MSTAAESRTVWLDAPATHFTESTPLGNGRLGAMLFGGVEEERIVLNESGMWSGSPQEADRAGAAAALPEIRRLLLEGRHAEAEQLVQEHFTCAGAGSGKGVGANVPYGCYQTLGNLWLKFHYEDEAGGGMGIPPMVADAIGGTQPSREATAGKLPMPLSERGRDARATTEHGNTVYPTTEYRRELDLGEAVARVTYTRGGVRFTREAFASAPDEVIVLRLTTDRPGALSLDVRLDRPERFSTSSVGDQGLRMTGQLNDGREGGTGVRYATRVHAFASGGTVRTTSDAIIQIRAADEVRLLVTAVSDIRTFAGRLVDDAVAATESDLAAAASKSYEVLRDAHVADYRAFYNRVSLRLGPDEEARERRQLTAPARLQAFRAGEADPDLAALLFDFGRYLLISSARPGGLPANLQGIWAEEIQTPWNGDWHTNINVQMNYWPADVCNLSELHQPLFALIASLQEPGARTARTYYGARGWVAFLLANPWGFTSPGESASWGSTSSCSAWLCQHLWDHYRYTGDPEFLAWAYPIMKGSALFYLDMLIEEPTNGWLVTAPSNSPENAFLLPDGTKVHVCLGPTIDQQLLRYLFAACEQASAVLGVDEAFRAELAEKRARLAPTRIGSDGRIMEWLDEYEEADPHHRHVAHLWGLFPGDEIYPRTTPELAAAARRTLERRGDAGTGWSLAYKIGMWARLGDGDRAHRLLGEHMKPANRETSRQRWSGGTYANLFGSHPPFQIDGNFGATAVIAEMLLQSRACAGGVETSNSEFEIDLLPALPTPWSEGEVRGLRARGGFEVDLAWEGGRLVGASFTSIRGGSTRVHWKDRIWNLTLAAGETAAIRP